MPVSKSERDEHSGVNEGSFSETIEANDGVDIEPLAPEIDLSINTLIQKLYEWLLADRALDVDINNRIVSLKDRIQNILDEINPTSPANVKIEESPYDNNYYFISLIIVFDSCLTLEPLTKLKKGVFSSVKELFEDDEPGYVVTSVDIDGVNSTKINLHVHLPIQKTVALERARSVEAREESVINRVRDTVIGLIENQQDGIPYLVEAGYALDVKAKKNPDKKVTSYKVKISITSPEFAGEDDYEETPSLFEARLSDAFDGGLETGQPFIMTENEYVDGYPDEENDQTQHYEMVLVSREDIEQD
jgi:hypothetical protein